AGAGGRYRARRRDVHHDDGHVIRGVAFESQVDEHVGRLDGGGDGVAADPPGDVGQLLAVHRVPQPVGAEDEAVALGHVGGDDVDLDGRVPAQAPGELGAGRVVGGLFGGEQLHAEHLADAGVVGRELPAGALPDEVGPAVA